MPHRTYRSQLVRDIAARQVPHYDVSLLCPERQLAEVTGRLAAALACARRLHETAWELVRVHGDPWPTTSQHTDAALCAHDTDV